MTTRSIPPFAQPDVPPLPVVILLDFTELIKKPLTSLLADEDLDASVVGFPNCPPVAGVRYHPYTRNEAGRAASAGGRFPRSESMLDSSVSDSSTPQSGSLVNMSTAFTRADSSPLSSPSPSLSLSPSSSPPPSLRRSPPPFLGGVRATKIKIERPKGASRSNLMDQVKWDVAMMNNLKVVFFSHIDFF